MAEKYLRPAFFIIGERKCGTSSLYRYLLDHPRVLPCKIKEPQFFSRSFIHRQLNRNAYRALFPAIESRRPVELEWLEWQSDGTLSKEILQFERPPSGAVTGEASANTFAQVPPARLCRAFPDARLLLLLRDPVARAYSHFQMYERFAADGRKLPFRMTDFVTATQNEISAIGRGDKSYFVAPGVYHKPLTRWLEVFGDQLMVLRSEDLNSPETVRGIMREVCIFLGLEDHDFGKVLAHRFNTSPAKRVPTEGRRVLEAFYSQPNRSLEALLQRKMHWS